MKKPEIIINKFSFYYLTKKGLKLLNKDKFKTSPWIDNIVKKKKFNLKKIKKIINIKKIKFPIVVKPIDEGSSIGVKICKNFLTLNKNVKFLFKKYEELIFEPYIGGQEIQVAVINGIPIGAIELEPKREFYDYKAKYLKSAKTKHIMPANLEKTKYKKVLEIAKKTHNALKCKGITRSDFKFFKNKFYILEINTQPGMTNLSLVPEIAKYKGISFENLVEKILLNASINR